MNHINHIEELAQKLNLDGCEHPWGTTLAYEGFVNGDGEQFAEAGRSRERTLLVVRNNINLLLERGIYESALIHAFVGCKTNLSNWDPCIIGCMFSMGNREKMRAVGAPLPGSGPFTVYRGVSGRGRRRRLDGFSWTFSLDVASWFAIRFHQAHPAILKTTVEADNVICYYTGRDEDELICRPEAWERVKIPVEEIEQRAKKHTEEKQTRGKRELGEAGAGGACHRPAT